MPARKLHYFNDTAAIFSILDHISDGFIFLDNEWQVVFWNKSAGRITNIPKEEVIGRQIWDVFPEARNTIFYSSYVQSKNENTPVEFQAFYDPMNAWLDVKADPVPDGLAIYFKDITRRKKLQVEMAYQKKQQESLINASTDCIYSVDREFRLLVGNKTFLDYCYFYSGKHINIGDCVLELMGEEEGSKWLPFYQRALAGEAVEHDLLMRYIVNGQSIYSQINFNPIIDEEKQEVVGVACYARDITSNKRYINLIEEKNRQLKQHEQNLLQTAQELEAVLYNSPDIIATVDKDGNYVSVNHASLHMLGYQPHEMEGKHFSIFVHPEDLDKTSNVTVKIIGGKKVTAFRNRLIKSNKEILHVMWSASWNIDQDLMFCVARDASDLYQAEQEKQEAYNRLNEVVKSLRTQNDILTKIAYIQSHEVRRPLANILGLINLLAHADMSPEAVEYFTLIGKSSNELDEMIRKIVSESFAVTETAKAVSYQVEIEAAKQDAAK